MKKTKIKIAIYFSLLLVTYAIFTGGMVLEFWGGFQWSGHSALRPKTDKLQSSLRIVDEPHSIFIPFVIWIHYSRGGPYPVELKVVDNTQQAKRIIIDMVEISFQSEAQKQTLTPPWIYDFSSTDILFWIDGELVETPVVKVEEILPITVDKDMTCRILLTGTLEKKNGMTEPFEIIETNEFKRGFRASTLWSGMHD